MRKILSILSACTLLLGATPVSAALSTSYDVENAPQMFLSETITPTQTSGIKLASPQINGSNYTFATTTGGVLRIRSIFFREDISYTSASVSSTTNIVTLSGVTRNICPQYGRAYVSCGNGRQWAKGSIVELNYDARLINLKANTDRANKWTASGAISFNLNGSGSLSFPIYSTTTQRDHHLMGTDGKTSCSIADGVCYYYLGGTWNTIGTSTTANATTTAAGKVETDVIADHAAKTDGGDSGAPVVVTTKHLTQSGAIHSNNSYQAGRVPILNTSGALAATLGGTGISSPSSGSLLTGYGSGAMKQILATGTNSGKTILSNGRTWRAANQPVAVLDSLVTAGPGPWSSGSQGAAEQIIYQSSIPANTLAVGDEIKIHASGLANTNSPTLRFRLRAGAASGTTICVPASGMALEGTARGFVLDGTIKVRTLGSSGTAYGSLDIKYDSTADGNQNACAAVAEITINTTATLYFTLNSQWSTNAGTSSVQALNGSTIRFAKP